MRRVVGPCLATASASVDRLFFDSAVSCRLSQYESTLDSMTVSETARRFEAKLTGKSGQRVFRRRQTEDMQGADN